MVFVGGHQPNPMASSTCCLFDCWVEVQLTQSFGGRVSVQAEVTRPDGHMSGPGQYQKRSRSRVEACPFAPARDTEISGKPVEQPGHASPGRRAPSAAIDGRRFVRYTDGGQPVGAALPRLEACGRLLGCKCMCLWALAWSKRSPVALKAAILSGDFRGEAAGGRDGRPKEVADTQRPPGRRETARRGRPGLGNGLREAEPPGPSITTRCNPTRKSRACRLRAGNRIVRGGHRRPSSSSC